MPPYFEQMTGPLKTVLCAYLVLKVLYLFRIELYDRPACVTDHMIMMAAAICMLVDIALLSPGDPFNEAAFHQQT